MALRNPNNYCGSISEFPGNWKRKAVSCLILVISVLLGTVNVPARVDADELALVLEERSDWWPTFIVLTEPVVSRDSPKELLTGQRGVLVRVEKQMVLADFGRNGLLSVPIGSTDILEQARELQQSPRREAGLLTGMLFNKLFMVRDAEVVECTRETFNGIDYMLFVYAITAGESFAVLTSQLEDFVLNHPVETADLKIVLVPDAPSQEALHDDLVSAGFDWPVLARYLAPGYSKSLAHGVSKHPGLVLTDKNGRILDRFEAVLAGGNLQQILESLPAVLSKDRSQIY